MDQIENILDGLARIIELISTGILLTGFGKAALGFIKTEWKSARQPHPPFTLSQLRLELGSYILLGLDFYIVSDIIHSMIRPELNEMVSLGIIVLMRTAIGYFLGKEIAEIKKSEVER